jgi:hypothetical protein
MVQMTSVGFWVIKWHLNPEDKSCWFLQNFGNYQLMELLGVLTMTTSLVGHTLFAGLG